MGRPNDLRTDDFYNLIAKKVGQNATPNLAKKYLKALYEVILDERTGEPIGYSLSQYQVGSWLHTMNMKEVMEKLQQAMVGAMPKGDTTTMNQVAVATANDPN